MGASSVLLDPARATVLLCLLAGAVYGDLRCRRIDDFLTVPAIVFGLVYNALAADDAGWRSSFLAMGVIAVFWIASRLGGGWLDDSDIKLVAAVGAICGVGFMLASFSIAAMVGGTMAVYKALRHRELGNIARRAMIWLPRGCRSRASLPPVSRRRVLRVPYSPPIAIGVLVCLYQYQPVGFGL